MSGARRIGRKPGPELDRLNERLSPQQRKIFSVIRAGNGLHERLMHAVYGDDPDGGPLLADKIIMIQVVHIRKKLRGTGWAIPRKQYGEDVPYRLVREGH